MAIGTTFTLGFDGKAVQRGLASIGGRLTSLAGGALKNITAGFVAMGAAIAAAGAYGIASFVKSSSEAAASAESLSSSFEVLTGSAEKAKGILAEIKKFGATTPLEQKDIQQSAQTLLAFGVRLEDVMPTLRMLGDVSAGNAEKLQSLALVFGQVSSAGKLTGGDLLQLINVGFNPLNEIAKRTGISMSDLRKMMEEGQITTAMLKQAFLDATGSGGMFNGMLSKMADTTEGKMSNLSDSITSLKVAFGTGFNDGLKVALDAVSSKLPLLEESFSNIGKRIGDAIGEAVAGNMDKLAAIGELIGSTIMAGLMASIYAGSAKIVEAIAKTSEFLNPFRPVLDQAGINFRQGSQHAGALGFKDYLDAELANRGIREKAQAVMGGPQPYIPIRSQSQPGDEQWKSNWSSMIRTPESTPNSPVPQQLIKQSEIQSQMLLELKKANQGGSKL